jgi:hypothetical protein
MMSGSIYLHCMILIILFILGIVDSVEDHFRGWKDEEDNKGHVLRRRRRLTSESDRPSIHTYYEQSETYDPTDDTLDLLENWRKNWYDMGTFTQKVLYFHRIAWSHQQDTTYFSFIHHFLSFRLESHHLDTSTSTEVT